MNEKIAELFGRQLDFFKSRGVDLTNTNEKVMFLDRNVCRFKSILVSDLEKYIQPLMQAYKFQSFEKHYYPVLNGSQKKFWELMK
jgi:hemolysin-activating ACP:hemolysin acyltransferase